MFKFGLWLELRPKYRWGGYNVSLQCSSRALSWHTIGASTVPLLLSPVWLFWAIQSYYPSPRSHLKNSAHVLRNIGGCRIISVHLFYHPLGISVHKLIYSPEGLRANHGLTLWAKRTAFTRSAITPSKLNRFGWNLECCEPILWGRPWQSLDAIRAVATVWEGAEFFSVTQMTNDFSDFPVGKIQHSNVDRCRHVNSRDRISKLLP